MRIKYGAMGISVVIGVLLTMTTVLQASTGANALIG